MRILTEANLTIACGGTNRHLADLVLGKIAHNPGSAVLACATSVQMADVDVLPSLVVSKLRSTTGSLALTRPPESLTGSWARVKTTNWKSVELSGMTERLTRVWLPATIVDAGRLFALLAMGNKVDSPHASVISLWAEFAHPWQRTGARLSNSRDGLTAEIARAVSPAGIVLFGSWRTFPLVIFSNDQVTAELTSLAFQQLSRDTPPDSGGPWENPLVQRASELGIGISQPGQIAATLHWLGEPESPASEAFTRFAAELLARIGVSSSK